MNQDLSILQSINQTLSSSPDANQRELAKSANVSIGLMNAILKRFAERGWIMLKNVNARKIAYALTDRGLSELKKRSRNFAKRTFALASEYNEIIYEKILEAKSQGKKNVVLYGKSYVKFLLEYACSKLKITFEERNTNQEIENDSFCLAGELEEDEIQEKLEKNGAKKILDLIGNYNFGEIL